MAIRYGWTMLCEAESLARMANMKSPRTVGMPPIWLPLRPRPSGRNPPAGDNVQGALPPDAPRVTAYGWFVKPFGNDAGEIAMAAAGSKVSAESDETVDRL